MINYQLLMRIRELRTDPTTALRINYDLLARVLKAKEERAIPINWLWSKEKSLNNGETSKRNTA